MAKNASSEIKALKLSLDSLIIDYLNAVSEYEQARLHANELLRSGYIDQSRARLSAGSRGIGNYQETAAPFQLGGGAKSEEMTDCQKQAARRMFGIWPSPSIVSAQASFCGALDQLLLMQAKAERANQLAETLEVEQRKVALALGENSSAQASKAE